MSDASARGVRHLIFAECQIDLIEAFPQKDDENNRVFKEAKLSTMIMISLNSRRTDFLSCRVHDGKFIDSVSPTMQLPLDGLRRFDPEYLTIPIGNSNDVRVVQKLYNNPRLVPFATFVEVKVGEIDMTNDRDCVAKDKTDCLLLKGAHVQRYHVTPTPKQGDQEWIDVKKFHRKYHGSPKERLYKTSRVAFQGVTGTDDSRRLKCAMSEPGHFLANSVNYFDTKKTEFNCGVALALMNSKFFEWRFRLTSTNNNVNNYEIEALPVPSFEFTSAKSAKDVQKRLDSFSSRYRSAIQKLSKEGDETKKSDNADTFAELLTKIGEIGRPLLISLEVIHDLLMFLAQEMMELNREKETLVRRFLSWLEGSLQVAGNKDGDEGLEALAGKTTIKGYLGDYYMGESHVSFETFFQILKKNSGRLGRSLNATFENTIQKELDKSLALLLPIKEKLAATDWLIDQLVYRLYGLTAEEVAIVAGNSNEQRS
jgi:hypothetical protein